MEERLGLLFFERAGMHEGIVFVAAAQKLKALAKVVLDSLLLIDGLDLTHVVLLTQLDVLFHVVERVVHDVFEQSRNLVGKFSWHYTLEHL